MKTLVVRTSREWRDWRERHHGSESEVWLVFHKQHTGIPSIDYKDALDQALCYGWVDSLIKRLDDNRFVRKFTPRKPASRWSDLNRKRYAELESFGRLKPAGIARAPGCPGLGSEASEARAAFEASLIYQTSGRSHPDALPRRSGGSRVSLVRLLIIVTALSGCEEMSRACTEEFRAGLVIRVRDSVTNNPAGDGAVATARDGSYMETLTYFPPETFSGAGERAGTYTIQVTKGGYAPWSRDVRVVEDGCHVHTVEVDVRLQHGT